MAKVSTAGPNAKHAGEDAGISQAHTNGEVAQVGNLLYRRLPVGRALKPAEMLEVRGVCGLEIRDTADWKSALR